MEEILPDLVKENDRFLFYYSGHGTTRKLGETKRGYLPRARVPLTRATQKKRVGYIKVLTWAPAISPVARLSQGGFSQLTSLRNWVWMLEEPK